MAEYDESTDSSQRAELSGPDEPDGLYTSQLHDWIPLSPELRDSAVRLYWILRALVIEKRGPVRKLTLLQLCYLLPAKPAKPGEPVKPSSLARIRSLLKELSVARLLSTPEGGPIKTSSRANASGAPLRIRINDKPRRGYAGPRNAFALLDEVRKPAAEAAEKALKKERERAERKRAERAATDAGQKSSPRSAGQKSSPLGQKSSPLGQKSSPHPGSDLQDREPPFSPPVHTLRSDDDGLTVRPSVQVEDMCVSETDGRTDAVDIGEEQQEERSAAEPGSATAADAASADSSKDEGVQGPHSGDRHRETTPGVEILRRVGQRRSELALAGKVMADQARRLNGLLAASYDAGDPWMPTQLVDILSVPLDGPVRVSAGAVISARITGLPMTPNAAAGMVPWQATGEGRSLEDQLPSSTPPAAISIDDRRVHAECPGCGDISPGAALCGRCQGWPECDAGCGRLVSGGGSCDSCESDAYHAAIAAEPLDDGSCAGYNEPCGQPVVNLGLCWRCRVKKEEARRDLDAEWTATVAKMAEAAEAAGEQQDHAPF
ncbi:hypothetical protein AB0C93_37885 [Streptomyces sp. NPDC048518]|uniref:hypothetical protein n=1 Tax=Streptomyces sp. NPDC048518 TaxID=3155029 RepID=UPI00340CDF3E